MSDLRDFTGKNRRFTGTDSVKIPSGTTGERVNGTGKLRYNTTTNLMEYYTATEWKAIDSPPVVNTISVDGGADQAQAAVDPNSSGNATIVIKGILFDTSNAVVLFSAASGSDVSPLTTTINSASQITVTVARSSFSNANEPYGVRVTNPSGLSATLSAAIVADTVPTFINAVDTTASIFDSARSGVTITANQLCGATDAESDALTYAVTSGSLPSGLTMAGSSGEITGSVSAVGSDTTSTFTCTVSQGGGGASVSRQFKITVKAPVVETFNSSGTFTVPSGLTAVDVLVVAGGGGSNQHHDGGGGGGGLIYRPGFTVSSPFSVTIGNGGIGGPIGETVVGQDSVFSTLTAKGGGTGSPGAPPANTGGSGAGGNHSPSNQPGKPGIQPTQPGDSGTYGFGNPGGNGFYTSPPTGAQGGGGGGAAAAGGNAGPNNMGNGGAGKQYSISGSPVYYAGGGGGGGHQNATGNGQGGIGGGGNAGSGPGAVGQNGTANRGGGAGGGNDSGSGNNRTGGTGVVIVRY